MSRMLKRRGLLFILSSPSGSGKTSIIKNLLAKDSTLTLSVSVTTRAQRLGEIHGKDYYFISLEEFHLMHQNNAFAEHAEVFGNCYGTSQKTLQDHLAKNEDVLLDIDWQGARRIYRLFPEHVVRIFIMPPSLEELENRLKTRNLDAEPIIAHRMAQARAEISHYDEYDYLVINDCLDHATHNVLSIIHAERCRQKNLSVL